MKTIFILTSKINIAPAEHAVCRNRVEIRVKLRWSVLFFAVLCFLFLPETGITAQAAPPELIIFVFVSCYKRYAPPELWLLLWKRYSYQCDDNNDRQELWLCMKTIFILTSKINIAPAEHAVCRNSSVGASCFLQFFVFLFLPETGITAQVAPPELIIFVFTLCYKRYAPPELWLFSTIDSHNGLKKRFPLQSVAGTFS